MEHFERPTVTADMLVPNERGEILLIKRNNDPYKGHYALPGGFIEVHQETIEQCAVREAEEETGLKVEIERLTGVYSDPKRDPRWHNITAVYLAKTISMEQAAAANAGDDAGEILWINPHSEAFRQMDLAFDHHKVIADAMPYLR